MTNVFVDADMSDAGRRHRPGATMRDYLRATDMAKLPDELVALYDDGTASGGKALYFGDRLAAVNNSAPKTVNPNFPARRPRERCAEAAARDLLGAFQWAARS